MVLASGALRDRSDDVRERQHDYSRFEFDNLQRSLTWEYLDLSNLIVAQIGGSPRAGDVAAAVTDADAHAGAALAAYRGYHYATGVQQARAACDELMAAADAINVRIARQAYQAVRRARAIRSPLEPGRKVARMLKRHLAGVLRT
jgi:hypothetical protein